MAPANVPAAATVWPSENRMCSINGRTSRLGSSTAALMPAICAGDASIYRLGQCDSLSWCRWLADFRWGLEICIGLTTCRCGKHLPITTGHVDRDRSAQGDVLEEPRAERRLAQADECIHACQQFRLSQRLPEDWKDWDVARLRHGRFVHVSGYQQDREIGTLRSDAHRQLRAVHPGHGEIGNEKIDRLAFEKLESRGAVPGLGDCVSGFVEAYPDELANLRIVFDQQDPPMTRHLGDRSLEAGGLGCGKRAAAR